jgi:hypothetical protein
VVGHDSLLNSVLPQLAQLQGRSNGIGQNMLLVKEQAESFPGRKIF